MSDKAPPIVNHIATSVDLGAAVVAVGSLAQLLPQIAAALAIVWYAARFVQAFRGWLDRVRNKKRRKDDT